MRKLTSIIFSAALLASAARPAAAMPWHSMGPRAMGMGGSQVALAQGPLASYWNPAGLGQLYNKHGLSVPVGARGEFTGSVLEGANNVYQLHQDCAAATYTTSGTCTQARITEALNLLGQNGNGAMVDTGAGIDLKIWRIVAFANNLAYAAVTPDVDKANTTPATIRNNASSLIIRGGSFTELGLGYAHEIGKTGLILGGNLKGIIGRVGYDSLSIISNEPGAGSFNSFKDNTKTSFQPAIDAGMLWDMRETFPVLPMRPRFGLVGRNLNGPKFKQPDVAVAAGEGKFKLRPQARMGIAVSPFKFWHLTADMDLTENLTLIDGRKSRYLGAGTEINVFNRNWLNIPLRVGLQKNVSKDSDSGVAYTAGIGLHFLYVRADIGAMVSSKTTTLKSETETEKIPNNVAASGSISIMWGKYDEGKRKN